MTVCPRCNQSFFTDAEFQSHAISVHNAPVDAFVPKVQGTPITIPPQAQMLTTVDPKQMESETEPYIPQSDTKDRPRINQPEIPHSNAPQHIEEEKKRESDPLMLTYKYTGRCPSCSVEVSTTVIKVKGEHFAIALCPKCSQVQANRKVSPL